MSLINNMLQDLEERQALAGITRDRVLGDLHASSERAMPALAARALQPLSLLLLGLLICYLGYGFYSDLPLPWRSNHVTAAPVAVVNPQRAAPAQAAAPPVSAPLPQETEALTLRSPSLKMDTSAFTTLIPESISSADVSDDAIPVAASTVKSPLVAPLAAVNRLLHISLTDLAGGSAVQVNTSAFPDYSLYLLKNPERLLVEVRGLEMPTDIVQADYRSDVVTRLRHGIRGNTSLLIFDLKQPVQINSSDVRVIPTGGGYSLDIELLHGVAPAGAASADDAQPKAGAADSSDTADAGAVKQKFQKNVASGDTQLLDRAMSAYHDGDVLRAIDLLSRLLARDPQQLQARITLGTILMQQQDHAGAVRVLTEGLRLHPGNADLIKLYAKQLFVEGRLDDALGWLRRAHPDIAVDPDYYALTAAVLQRRRNYADAGELYGKLVTIHPDRGVWWLGLGIAMEGVGRPDQALQAYGKARTDRTLSADLMRYIDSRIRTLGG